MRLVLAVWGFRENICSFLNGLYNNASTTLLVYSISWWLECVNRHHGNWLGFNLKRGLLYCESLFSIRRGLFLFCDYRIDGFTHQIASDTSFENLFKLETSLNMIFERLGLLLGGLFFVSTLFKESLNTVDSFHYPLLLFHLQFMTFKFMLL